MTRAEFTALFPNASEAVIRANVDEFGPRTAKPSPAKSHASKTNLPRNSKPRTRPVFQKLQDDSLETEADHDKAGASALDGIGRPQFRVSVTFRISDERHRDNDGGYSTLADCLIAAVGRLAKMDPRVLRTHANRVHRK